MDNVQMRKALERHSREFVCCCDPTGTFIEINDSVNNIIGIAPKNIIGKNIYEFIHEEDKEFFEMNVHFPSISGNKNTLNADVRFKNNLESYLWLNIDITPVFDEKNILTSFTMFCRDVTDYILLKEKFDKQQALLVHTGQMAKLGLWELDLNLNVATWSKETYDIFEVSESFRLSLDSVSQFFIGSAADMVRKAHINLVVHGVAYDLTLPFETAKKKKIWVRVISTPKIHFGKVVKVYGVIQNIDKEVNDNLILKSMVKQLTKQNRQLEDFTHILSHNVRGPIASLTTLLNMLENVESEGERKEIMDMLKMSSKSLEDLLTELKEVINATHVRGIESQENDLAPIINYSKELLKGEIHRTKAVIGSNLSGWDTIVYPKIYLESIIMNLMSNALKYKAEDRKPEINISTFLENGLYVLKFSDNGSGIDLERNGNNMFKLYKTFHATKPGKGLGLFMTKSQIEAMGGEISVESKLGVGTTFTIIFNKEKENDTSSDLMENIVEA